MEDLQACRVCLATGVKLFDMYIYSLKGLFELFSGIQVSPADNYPQYLCTYCTALLLKCNVFRLKCRKSQELMKFAEIENQVLTTTQIQTIAISNRTTLHFTTSSPEITTIIDVQIKTEEKPISEITFKQESNEQSDEEVLDDQSDEEPLANKVKKSDKITIKVDIRPLDNGNDDDDNDFDQFDNATNVLDNENDFSNNDIEIKYLTKGEQLEEVLARKDSYNYIHSFYKCEHCYKGFIQDGTYKNHMLRHDPANGKETCDICKTRWPDTRSLKSHITTAHERKYICKLCDQVTKSSHRAKEHLKWHKGFKFVCKICGALFSKSTSHLTHLRLQHPSKYCCDVCGESFIGEMGLNMHKKKAHKGFEKSNNKNNLKCEMCAIYFKSMDALNRHVKGYDNGICDSSLSSCFHCGENVLTKELLREHLKTHVGFRCEECNRNFASERSFSVHYQRVHLGVKLKHYKPKDNIRIKAAWVCEMCGRKCISNAALVYHQRTHTGEKPYQCKECPKNFTLFQRLKIHQRTHTGERPFKCTNCPKAFKQKAALNRHDRVHSGAKPYQCGHCGKTFSQSNSMKVHVRTVHLKMPAPYRARRDRNNELEFLVN